MGFRDEVCGKCIYWHSHKDGYGDCWATMTSRLITAEHTRCPGKRIKFKPKEKKHD